MLSDAGAEKETLCLPHRQSDPTRAQGAPEMAMREDGNIALQRLELSDQLMLRVRKSGRAFRRAEIHLERDSSLAASCEYRNERRPSHSPQSHSVRSDSISATSPNPANSHVRPARCSGLVNPRRNLTARSRSASLRASCSPCLVSGISVRPVCWPESDQVVSSGHY
jgi:hypothetical protein